MAVYLPNKSRFYIGTMAALAAYTAASNASECVLSFASDPGLAADDEIEITSGWESISGNVYRVKSVAGSGPYTVTVDGLNTSDTSRFAAGSGVGSVRQITAWTEITQVETPSISGGEQQFVTYQPISAEMERRLPSFRSAQAVQLGFFDDPELPWYDTVAAASLDNANAYGLKIALHSGATLYASGYWSLQKFPSMAANTPMKANIDVALLAEFVRYNA